MSIYDEFRDLDKELIDGEFGRPAILTRITKSYSPLTGNTETEQTEKPVRATLAPLKEEEVEGVIRTRSTVRMLARPSIGDTISFGQDSFQIDTVTLVPGDGFNIIYVAEVSR